MRVNGTFHVLRAASWLPVLLWYRVIWNFSAQTAAVSGNLSDRLLWRLLHQLSPSFAGTEQAVQDTAVEVLSFFERKAAHMFLYFVLALLLWASLSFLIGRKTVRGTAATVLCTALAGLDEFHQTLVPGRSGQLRDVFIDLAGAGLALGLVALLLWTGRIRRKLTKSKVTAWALAPMLICAAGLVLGPILAEARLADPVLNRLAAQFVQGFSGLDASVQEEMLRGLRHVVGDTLRLGFSGLLGCVAVLPAALCGLTPLGATVLSLAVSVLFACLAGLAVSQWAAVPACLGMAVLGVGLSGCIWLASWGVHTAWRISGRQLGYI